MHNQFIRWGYVFLGVASVGLGLGLVKMGYATPKDGGQALAARETVWDFGSRVAGTTACHEFKLQNISTKTVAIDAVLEPCGCVKVKLSKSQLAPSATAQLRFTLDGPHQSGPFRFAIPVIYRVEGEPASRYKLLELRGQIAGIK